MEYEFKSDKIYEYKVLQWSGIALRYVGKTKIASTDLLVFVFRTRDEDRPVVVPQNQILNVHEMKYGIQYDYCH